MFFDLPGRLTALALAGTCVLLTSACSSNPTRQAERLAVPSALQGQALALGTKVPRDESGATWRFVNEAANVVYTQAFEAPPTTPPLFAAHPNTAGAGVAVEATTAQEQARLMGKVTLDPAALFTQAAKDQAVTLADDGAGVATPYVWLVKQEGDQVQMAAALVLQDDAGAKPWSTRYVYQLDISLRLDELAQTDEATTARLNEAVQHGFVEILKAIKTESPQRVALERPVRYQTRFLQPRSGEMQRDGRLMSDVGDRVWLRDGREVYALRKSQLVWAVLPCTTEECRMKFVAKR